MADVQVVLSQRLRSFFLLSLTLRRGHAQLTSLGERLEVVGRHGPEVKIRLIPEQPAVNQHRNISACPRVDDILSGVKFCS